MRAACAHRSSVPRTWLRRLRRPQHQPAAHFVMSCLAIVGAWTKHRDTGLRQVVRASFENMSVDVSAAACGTLLNFDPCKVLRFLVTAMPCARCVNRDCRSLALHIHPAECHPHRPHRQRLSKTVLPAIWAIRLRADMKSRARGSVGGCVAALVVAIVCWRRLGSLWGFHTGDRPSSQAGATTSHTQERPGNANESRIQSNAMRYD